MRAWVPMTALLVLVWSGVAQAGDAESKRADALYKEAIALVEGVGDDQGTTDVDTDQAAIDRLVEQAMNDQEPPARKREPDY